MRAKARTRLHALHTAEVERWREAWESYYRNAGDNARRAAQERGGLPLARRLYKQCTRFWEVFADGQDGEDAELFQEVVSLFEEKRGRMREAFEPGRFESWDAWTEDFELHRGVDPDAPDLLRWPHLVPAPPEDPAPMLDAAFEHFEAADDDTAEALYLSYVVETTVEALELHQRSPLAA